MIDIKKPFDTNNQKEFQRRKAAYKRVYETLEGKEVLDDILYYTAINRTAFCLQSDTQTHFNLGKQSIGYHIINILNHNTNFKGKKHE